MLNEPYIPLYPSTWFKISTDRQPCYHRTLDRNKCILLQHPISVEYTPHLCCGSWLTFSLLGLSPQQALAQLGSMPPDSAEMQETFLKRWELKTHDIVTGTCSRFTLNGRLSLQGLPGSSPHHLTQCTIEEVISPLLWLFFTLSVTHIKL